MSRGRKRAVVVLSDSDSDQDEEVDFAIETKVSPPKRRKPLQLSKASVTDNGVKGAKTLRVERFCRQEPVAKEGAFAWPSFRAPANKPKAEPAQDQSHGTPSTQNGPGAQTTTATTSVRDTSIWAEKYFPALEEELAVHKKKVNEVKAWLEARKADSSGGNVLLLVGPPGTGKSTTVQVLCKTLDFPVVEWQTPVPVLWEEHVHQRGSGPRYSSKLDDFDAFLDKAEKFPLVPFLPSLSTLSLEPQLPGVKTPRETQSASVNTPTEAQSASVRTPQEPQLPGVKSFEETQVISAKPFREPQQRGFEIPRCVEESKAETRRLNPQRKVVLLDDMPLAAEGDKRQRLCDTLETLARSARFPTVVILSKGEAGQSGQGDSQRRWGATAAMQQALERGGAATICFNPVTSANICKVLARVANLERYDPSEDDLAAIAEESRGDLRQALVALQFHCIGRSQSAKPVKKGKKKPASKKAKKAGPSQDVLKFSQSQSQPSILAEDPIQRPGGVGSRDSSLHLFHALGKFLHNKRTDADVSADVDADLDLRPELRRRPMASSQPPEATLARAHLDGPAVTSFLHENLLDFVDDDAIDDVSCALAYVSDADRILARRGGGTVRATVAEDQGSDVDPGRVGQAAAASVSARGVLFGIAHPAPKGWRALRPPVSGQVERRRQETMAQIQRAALSTDSGYLAPGGAGSAVLALELLPYMKLIESMRKWRAAHGAGPARQEESLADAMALSSWAPVFEVDRRKGTTEVEEEEEDIEEW